MLSLFLGHIFLFLQFLLGHLLLCNLLFRFRYNLLFFNRDHLSVADRAQVGVNLSMSSVSPGPISDSVPLDVLDARDATSKPLSVTLLSAFLSTCGRKFTLFGSWTLCPAPLFDLDGYASQLQHCNDGIACVASVK